MQQITAILLLCSAIFAGAMPILRPGLKLEKEQNLDLTFSIRRLEPHEAARGNLYHLYQEQMASLNSSSNTKGTAAGIDWGSITNIGKQVWDIIVKNQPTSDVKTAYGAAVPKGISDWHSLTNWQQPVSESYSIEYYNLYKATVIKFDYHVVYIYGGQYENKGQYLTGVQIIPSNVEVAWGYNFACSVEIPQVLNAGSQDSPIGAVQLTLAYTVETVVSKNRQTKAWWIKGTGEIDEL